MRGTNTYLSFVTEVLSVYDATIGSDLIQKDLMGFIFYSEPSIVESAIISNRRNCLNDIKYLTEAAHENGEDKGNNAVT